MITRVLSQSTETLLLRGWQADIAATIDPTSSESVALRLAPKKPKWKLWNTDSVLANQMQDAHDAAYNALPTPVTVLVEVKSSGADLRSDSKWGRTAPADLSFVAVPEKLVEPALSLLPEWWGVIRVTERGCRVMRWAVIKPVSAEQRLSMVYAIAICRDHRTRYKALRESEKQARVDRIHGIRIDRWSQVVKAVTMVAKGGRSGCFQYSSVADVLRSQHVGHVPESVIEQLEELWGTIGLTEKGLGRPVVRMPLRSGTGLLATQDVPSGSTQGNA